MRNNMLTLAILGSALAVLGTAGAFAQHDQHHPQDQTTQEQSKDGMMGGCQNGMMGGMMAEHQKMTGLMTKLMESMKAIEAEKDPAVLKQKLAEHQALLDQMHSQMMEHDGMMKKMSGSMPMMNDKMKNAK